MKNIFRKLEPIDLIAIIVLVGGLYLKLKGCDGVVGSLITAIVFYYFGKKGAAIIDAKNCDNNTNNTDQK